MCRGVEQHGYELHIQKRVGGKGVIVKKTNVLFEPNRKYKVMFIGNEPKSPDTPEEDDVEIAPQLEPPKLCDRKGDSTALPFQLNTSSTKSLGRVTHI